MSDTGNYVPCPIPVMHKRGKDSPLIEQVLFVVPRKRLLKIDKHVNLFDIVPGITGFLYFLPFVFQNGWFLLPCLLSHWHFLLQWLIFKSYPVVFSFRCIVFIVCKVSISYIQSSPPHYLVTFFPLSTIAVLKSFFKFLLSK